MCKRTLLTTRAAASGEAFSLSHFLIAVHIAMSAYGFGALGILPMLRRCLLKGCGKSLSTFSSPQILTFPFEAKVRNARYDKAFKILIGENNNRAASFLNAILNVSPDDEEPIMNVKFLNNSKSALNNLNLEYDIVLEAECETKAGHRFIVEMQKARQYAHSKRWIFYGARELTAIGELSYDTASKITNKREKRQFKKSQYDNLVPVKTIVVLDFEPGGKFDNKDDIVVHWDIVERKKGKVAETLLSWTFVILPRFNPMLEPKFKATSKLEAWLYLLTREDNEKVTVTKEMVANDDAVAHGFYRISNLNETDSRAVEYSKKAYLDEIARIDAGVIMGRDEGLQEGHEKGLQEGHEKGLQEGRKEVARSMLRANLDVNVIAKLSNLSIEAVKVLEAEVNGLK